MSNPKIKRNILLNPGPATTTDTVKLAQVVPDICPREREFSKLLRQVCDDLVDLAHGGEDYTCILFGGSGTAAMDACVNSVVPPGGRILVVNNGEYGKRMADIAKAYGIDCLEMKFLPGEAINLHKLEAALSNDSEIACVAIVHHETTTGMLNPIHEVGKIVKNYGRVFCVDAISSFGGMPVHVKDLGVDFLIGTSNKCLQAMSGAAFIIAKREEVKKISEYPRRSYYLDLFSQAAFFKKTGQTQFTPPVQTLYSFNQALKELRNEGVTARLRRYSENSEVLRTGLERLGFKLLLTKEQQSPFLITVLEPEDADFSFELVHDLLYERGFTIYPGKLAAQKTFRIANIGDIRKNDIEAFLKNLGEILEFLRKN